MDVLLLVVLIGGFIGNILAMRFFLKRLSDKLTFLSPETASYISPQSTTSTENKPLSFSRDVSSMAGYRVDQSFPNQIGEDEQGLDLNEQNLSGLPKDVKFEVEGGDTHTPPGFVEYKK